MQAPEHQVVINAEEDVERTQATFTILSPGAADYAYLIAEEGADPVTDAKELFETGTVGQLEDGSAVVTTHDIEGAKNYVVYTAVRRINPYLYSEVEITPLSTDIPYTKLVTLDKIGKREINYHIEVPEGEAGVKHYVVKKFDYEYIARLLATIGEVNPRLYLDTFGHKVTETTDYHVEDIEYTTFGDTYSHIHGGTEYMLLGGIVDENGRVSDEDKFMQVNFFTRAAAEAPYDIEVTVTTTSTSATVYVKPAPEFVNYRIMIEKRSEFEYVIGSDKMEARNSVIGFWDDSKNEPNCEYSGYHEFVQGALIPQTEYVVAIVGFDEFGNEKYIRHDFVTGEPTGPKPTVTVTEVEPEVVAPWSTKAFNVTTTHAVELRAGFFVKSQVDQLLRNGSTLQSIMIANADAVPAESVANSMTEEGVTFEVSNLQPVTQYVFIVYVRNEEYATAVEQVAFFTAEMPKVGGEVRKNMPGKYIATALDEDDNIVTFPVTIATGADATTSAQYDAMNRLVAFGFGPEEDIPFKYPSELMADGVDMETAYRNYDPKWFIEFASETEIYIPISRVDKYSGTNFLWVMMNDNGTDYAMFGNGLNPRNGRDCQAYPEQFPVEVSADGKTVTVKGIQEASGAWYYPLMGAPKGWSFNEVFRSYSDITLTKIEEESKSSLLNTTPVAPKAVTLREQSVVNAIKARHTAAAERLK